MSKTSDWLLRKIPVEIKTEIQELAKKEKLNANEKVSEILNDYLYDIELGKNKNYFDKRWQEIIDSYNANAEAQRFLAEAQNKNTEAFGNSFAAMTERIQELQNLVFATHEEVEILRGVQQMMIGYSPKESQKFAKAYKKYLGESLMNEKEIMDPFESQDINFSEGDKF
ncbi:hypothetical protein OGZ51_10335 [Lactococcus lactis]|uniref:Uncharacterized protein n=1 Tax=Lactococcus lactis TaxID=1358 RepID=A0A9X4NIT4_9LACT|nr:hypothetical protein [Lactococcus lactis]MDG4984542.1 hypothetical protein [Lactococcus lactis]